jgi:hypothetical protein
VADYRTFLTFHPSDPPDTREALLTDLLELRRQSKHRCVDKMIQMIEDLRSNGPECRYIKGFPGSAIFELKGRTSDGGARVYCFRVGKTAFVVGRAECKKEAKASTELVGWLEDAIKAWQEGEPVLSPRPRER